MAYKIKYNSMKYEIYMELKNNGYPQGEPRVTDFYNKETGERVRVPFLEEVIEACGIGFRAIVREASDVHGQWIWAAKPMIQPNEGFITDYVGSTPSEAVASLWLSLNKK